MKDAMTVQELNGKPYAGNPYVRFYGREYISTKPWRGYVFDKGLVATVKTIESLVLRCVLLLCGSIAQAKSVNTYTFAGITWNLSADMVAGTSYAHNHPENTSVVFSGLDIYGDPTIYYNMTITGFRYESGNHSTAITIPERIGWDTSGDYGVGYGPVQYISSGAFYNKDITSVVIPSKILGIHLPCFRKCGTLESIVVGGANNSWSYYSSQDGILYDKDKTKLLKYPEGKKDKFFAVPVTVKEFAPYCFADVKNLTIQFLGEKPTMDSTSFDGSTYTEIVVEDGVLTKIVGHGATEVTIPGSVTSIGDGAFEGCSGLTNVTIGNGVTSIGANAFCDCWGLTSVTIPDSVTSIGDGVFVWCGGLTNVVIGRGVTSIGDNAFSRCSGLMSIVVGSGNAKYTSVNGLLLSKDGKNLVRGVNGNVTIPNSVTSIGDYAFDSYSGLTSVTIPNSVTNIGDWAFEFCSGLTSVTIPDSVTSIGDGAFESCSRLTEILVDATNPNYSSANGLLLSKDGKLLIQGINGDVTIPDSVTSIGSYAFSGCSGLTSVTIPDSVTSIWSYAFSGCSGLTSVTIPDSVTSIGGYAFSDCNGLTSVTIPDNVTSIGGFYGCSGLADANGFVIIRNVLYSYLGEDSEITIPASVTSIGVYAFRQCDSLTSVTIPDSVTSIGSYAFSGCSGLTSVTIPDSVTSIGDGAFEFCRGLTSVTIGNGVTSIGAYAFGYSLSLYDTDSIPGVRLVDGWVIGNSGTLSGALVLTGVRGVGDGAFRYCSGLTSVTIPDSVTSIGRRAFEFCSGLTSVMIGNGVTSIGDHAFHQCDSLTSVYIADLAKWCGISFGSWDANPLHYAHNLYLNGVLVTDLTIPDGVTNINAGAFEFFSGLTSVTIPDSVTNIGDGAFYCSGLTSVTIGNGVTNIGDWAFYCSGLTSVTIGNGVTSIGDNAFYRCDSLTSVYIADLAKWCGISFGSWDANPLHYAHNLYLNGVLVTDLTIPDGVTNINAGAFESCSGLTSVTIPNSVTSIGEYAFYDCWGLTSVTIPNSVTNIGDYAFCDCWGLTSVTIPDSVTNIGDGAFESCSGLTSVTIGNSVTSIGDGAFSCCSGLMSIVVGSGNAKYTSVNGLLLSKDGKNLVRGVNGNVTIPNSVTSIGDYAFDGYSRLTSVTIPDGVISIGDSAFEWCEGLTNVVIGSGVTSIGCYAFYGCNAALYDTTTISGVRLVDGWAVDNTGSLSGDLNLMGIRGIGDWTFEDCSGLTSVTIPDGVTSIGWGAFGRCSGLTSVTILDGVTSIWDYAFWYCSGLRSVTIPDSVTSIGEGAFMGCALEDVYLPKSLEGHLDTSIVFGPDTSIHYRSMDNSLPEVALDAAPEAVTNAIETVGFADAGVKEAIGGSAEKYAAFKTWAGSVKGTGSGSEAAGEAAVIVNTNAAVAFLLGAERLFERLPTIEIGEVSVGEKGTQGTEVTQGTGTQGQRTGTEGMTLTVSVIVKDGEETVQCAAEKVKEMFEAVSDLGDWTNGGRDGARPSQLPVTVEIVEGDTETSSPSQLPTSSPSSMRFKVTPGDGTATRAFLRVKVK